MLLQCSSNTEFGSCPFEGCPSSDAAAACRGLSINGSRFRSQHYVNTVYYNLHNLQPAPVDVINVSRNTDPKNWSAVSFKEWGKNALFPSEIETQAYIKFGIRKVHLTFLYH